MAPTHLTPATTIHTLLTPRAATSPGDSVPLVSIFALVGARTQSSTTISSPSTTSSNNNAPQSSPYTLGSRALPVPFSPNLSKRQTYILAIPTTYDTINSSPAPGAVAGITLGAVFGSILVLWLLLLILRTYTGRAVVKTEIIEKHSHHRNSRRSRSSRAGGGGSRRVRTKEEVRVERSVSRPAPAEESVVVEEEEDDIVEVIEEHSPERRPTKRGSGFRTVDPAEFGGGNAPRRKVGRR